MKKIFLIPLLTLLCTVMAWGEVVNKSVEDKPGLDAALLEAASVDSMVITLTANISFETTVGMVTNATEFNKVTIPSTAHVLLNLNGFGIQHTFTFTEFVAFAGDIDRNALIHNKGTLHVISQGNRITQLAVQEQGYGHLGNSTTFCNDSLLIIDGGVFVGPHEAMKLPVIWNRKNTATTIINGGTFLCDESVSDYNNGPDFGPLSGGGNWIIRGGIFSTNEMVGVSHVTSKKSTKQLFEEHATAAYTLQPDYKAIEVPYTNANIKGYDSWRTDTEKNSSKCVVDTTVNSGKPTQTYYRTSETTDKQTINGFRPYQRYRYAVKPVCMVVPTSADPDNFLYVSENTTITVPDGETLRVGGGGIVMGDATAKIVVAAGGTLISEGDIISSSNENIELTMDGRTGYDKYSTLLIKPNAIQAKHPNATVTLKSKGYRKSTNPDRYAFQRFAVPTYNNSITRGNSDVFDYEEATAIYRLTDANTWQVMYHDDDEAFEPFRCYDMTVQAPAQGTEYVFKSELVGNGNPILTLYNDKWNYFGNSYTAPIDIAAMIKDLNKNYGHIKNSVWVHNIGDDVWNVITKTDVELGEMDVQKIQPMQAFVYLKQGEGEDPELDYEAYVYNPFMGIEPNNAPKRKVANDYTRATMTVEAANGQSNTMKMYEGERFDSSFDSENNVEKLMNENAFNMYFAFEEGNLERVASDNLGNMALTLETKDETSYTVNFKNVTLEGYVLRDNLTGTETEIVSGNTYSFSAPANSKIEGRFEIVTAAKMPTAIDDVEVNANANANVKGIYTLTGQYMGENFHVLPAGVYIINGKKVVK